MDAIRRVIESVEQKAQEFKRVDCRESFDNEAGLERFIDEFETDFVAAMERHGLWQHLDSMFDVDPAEWLWVTWDTGPSRIVAHQIFGKSPEEMQEIYDEQGEDGYAQFLAAEFERREYLPNTFDAETTTWDKLEANLDAEDGFGFAKLFADLPELLDALRAMSPNTMEEHLAEYYNDEWNWEDPDRAYDSWVADQLGDD